MYVVNKTLEASALGIEERLQGWCQRVLESEAHRLAWACPHGLDYTQVQEILESTSDAGRVQCGSPRYLRFTERGPRLTENP
jgi:hypothetical protein